MATIIIKTLFCIMLSDVVWLFILFNVKYRCCLIVYFWTVTVRQLGCFMSEIYRLKQNPSHSACKFHIWYEINSRFCLTSLAILLSFIGWYIMWCFFLSLFLSFWNNLRLNFWFQVPWRFDFLPFLYFMYGSFCLFKISFTN